MTSLVSHEPIVPPPTPEEAAVRNMTELAGRAFEEYKFNHAPTESYSITATNRAGESVECPMVLSPDTGDLVYNPDRPGKVEKLVWIPERNERLAQIKLGDGTVFYRHDSVIHGDKPGSFVTFWREGGDSIITTRIFTSATKRNYADPRPQPDTYSTYAEPEVVHELAALESLATGIKRDLDARNVVVKGPKRNTTKIVPAKEVPLMPAPKTRRDRILGKIGLRS